MSVIVASGEAISNSPLNHSKTKQMFSFSKAERFPKIKTNCEGAFYDLPEVRSKRFTTFGKGTKYDFTLLSKGKSQQIYNSKSDFDQDHPHSPRYTFGVGRDKYTKVFCEANKMLDMNVPGPGKYDYLKPFGSDAFKFTMRSRNTPTAATSRAGAMCLSPGPGTYNVTIKINENGKYPVSSISNVPQINIGADKTKRSDYYGNKNPGPSDYPQKQLLGNIFDSKHMSNPAKSILRRYKVVDSRENYPGPGQYRAFSEFGIYESKYATGLKGSASSPNIK